jgi:hypothetical protein
MLVFLSKKISAHANQYFLKIEPVAWAEAFSGLR